ncbi:MAG: 16S rRNA (adenine(1518)-N(6)/adenine(1519)-N(6))-dimethyltransferase RsmA [Candidatus Berkelbacteria bacterium]|nr:16S rRNA (adenine(1518)-N(6)/adenine(1519)-N(6))-dimethyltransferase RsmA [Candidatus Berkelbacteria bacterium]MCR4307212.1 16S rRNA (adenine(1518)-N(6)/adenine(1519)-N(6))-dimethyltransferase RsmA [Candidatus Berkelbacteria bacterium]
MKPAEILRDIKKLPNKILGQNFLVDESVVRDMISAAEIEPNDTVVEIGPGLGALTDELAKSAKQVLAIEMDQELANYLRLKKRRQVKIIHGDALKIDWTVTLDGPYRIVANIPYSITSPLLRKIFALERKPEQVVLLVQKEMAMRITAEPGSSERGFLTLLCEAAANVKTVRTVKPGSFYPRPKTDSAIIALTLLPENRASQIYWPAVEAGFGHKRQTLCNGINKDLKLSKAEIIAVLEAASLDPLIRPQNLSFDDWVIVSKGIEKLVKKS